MRPGLRRLLTRALENPAQLEVTVEAAFALKALERIGDHARNAAEQIVGIADQALLKEAAGALKTLRS